MPDIKWVKIATDIFDDEKILLLESRPDADSILIIWMKLLVLAGKTNNGGALTLTPDKPFTAEMLATIFKRPVETVRTALDCFESFGMIEIVDGVITLSNWEKHQNIEGMDRIREQNRLRKQRQRAKEREQRSVENGHVTSRDGHAIDKDKEEEEDKNKLFVEIVTYFNHVCGSNYKPSSKLTRQLISSRLNEGFTVQDFFTVIDTKAADWLHDTEMQKYLRPQTLFGTKFEGYLNQKKESNQRRVITHDEIEALRAQEEGDN